MLQDPYFFTGAIVSNVGLNNESVQQETIKDALIKGGRRTSTSKSDKGDYELKRKGWTSLQRERQLISFARAIDLESEKSYFR